MNITKSNKSHEKKQDIRGFNGHVKPLLVLTIDGDPIKIFVDSMADSATYAATVARCNHASEPVAVNIDPIFDHDEGMRIKLLRFLAGLKCRFRFFSEANHKSTKWLLTAILRELQPKDNNPGKHDLVLQVAKQWAVIKHSNNLDTACEKIKARLRELGEDDFSYESLVQDCQAVAASTDKAVKILEILAGKKPTAEQIAEAYLEYISDGKGPVLLHYQQSFYAWNGHTWNEIDDSIFEARIVKFMHRIDSVSAGKKLVGDVVLNLKAMISVQTKAPMPFVIKSMEPFVMRNEKYIVFRNGMLNIEAAIAGNDDAFCPQIDRMYFNTVVMDFDYDPDAACELWKQTIDEILERDGDNDKRQDILQEIMGYSLTPDCRHQKIFVLHGEGGNGKSTITKTWEAVLGSENVSKVSLSSMCKDSMLGVLAGKMANFCGELTYVEKVHEGVVKQIAEGETLEVDRKYKNPIRINVTAKLVINTNDLPAINDKTEGMWRRLMFIPFLKSFHNSDDRDYMRPEKLLKEQPGIFNWMLEGARRLREQGMFSQCELCSAAIDQHRTDTDSVRQFLNECFIANPHAAVYSGPMYEMYNNYCQRSNIRPMTKSTFGKQMKRLGHDRKQGRDNNRAYQYTGLDLSGDGEVLRRSMFGQNEHPTTPLGVKFTSIEKKKNCTHGRKAKNEVEACIPQDIR